MKATPQHVTTTRAAHHASLASLHATPAKADGLKMWRALARIEHEAYNAATAQCNGADYGGQPFRPDYEEDGGEWDRFTDSIRARVSRVFGGTLPPGFKFNQDPRGYALKLSADRGATIPAGMVKDLGGYGILAPVID